MNNPYFYAIGFNNRFKLFFLQFYLFLTNKKAHLNGTIFLKWQTLNGFFDKRALITSTQEGIGEVKGLCYEVNKKALEFTKIFFEKHLENSYLLRFSSKKLKTSKSSCYIKKKLVYDFYEALTGLFFVKEFPRYDKLILLDTLPNRFVFDEFSKECKVKFEIYWFNFHLCSWLILPYYYFYILKIIFTNGVARRDRKRIKLFKEAVFGLTRAAIRDDYLIDGINFRKNDIIFYSRYKDENRDSAADELKKAGYSVIDINKCKLNIKNMCVNFIDIFFLQPFYLFIVLIFNGMSYQIYNMLSFYIESFPIFLFLTNYAASSHLSNSDHGELSETIIMNRFGCKNIIYHWSDMTSFKAVSHAFTAHDLYCAWGKIHHDFQKEDYFHNKVEIVGCVYLRECFRAIALDRKARDDAGVKNILVCDNSFGNTIHFTDYFYFDFLDLVIEILDKIPDVKLIFKSKSRVNFLNYFSKEKEKMIYQDKLDYLNRNSRFSYYDIAQQIEPLIANSDIVITMGLTSPSMVALISHKEALYYDTTGNKQHPMTRYINQVVFDSKELLIEQVKNILNKQKSVFDYIDPDLLNQYDPYKDSKALERLIQAISREVEIPLAR